VSFCGEAIRSAKVVDYQQGLVQWAAAHRAALIVDQPGGAAALLLRLCWQAGVLIGYLHGLAMARARDFYAGEAKTDPKDAFVLADVARAHPTRVVWLAEVPEARPARAAVRLRRRPARRC
jgi:Transposase